MHRWTNTSQRSSERSFLVCDNWLRNFPSIFDKDHSTLGFRPQVYSFYQCHIYFTIRQILYQLGVIQSISALPGDPTFSQANNKYDMSSYKRICNDFGIDSSSDFRFTSVKNNGLGSIYIYVSNGGLMKTSAN